MDKARGPKKKNLDRAGQLDWGRFAAEPGICNETLHAIYLFLQYVCHPFQALDLTTLRSSSSRRQQCSFWLRREA